MALSPEQIKASLRANSKVDATRSTSAATAPADDDRHPSQMPEPPSIPKVDKKARHGPALRVVRGSGQRSTFQHTMLIPSTGSTVDIHRTPPHSVEGEQGVLGSMLISPRDAIPVVVAHAKADWFYVPAHQTIFELIVAMWDANQAIDLITFTQRVRDVGHLETVGGPAMITNLYTFVPTAANVGYYLDIVRDKYILRSIIAGCTECVRRAYEEQDEVGILLDEVEGKILSIGQERFANSTAIQSMKENTMRAIELIEATYERKGGISGLATGFIELDRMTSGMHPAEMIVLAARPSMGKTALAMNITEHLSIEEGKPVGVMSLEMSTEQLVTRMICSRARVNLQKVRDGFLSERDFPAITAATSKLAEAKIFIDDSGGLSILELRAKARRMVSQFHVELLVIDYLQLLHSASKRARDNRQVEVSEISNGIKSLTKELKIPILVLAQLNREPEKRGGGKPRLSDLRESGSIEQDADCVLLLTRPELYEEDDEARAEKAGEAELIIAKQRNGPVGDVPLTFLKEFTRFEDRARAYEQGEFG
jgi:replicative DNA helicase